MAHDQPTQDQSRELFRRAQAGDMEARTQLVQENLPLVVSIVKRFLSRGFDYDDLFQVGCLGLLKAILGFDLSYEVQFSTYAVPKIIGEIKRYMREDSPIHIARSLRELASRAIAAKDMLGHELGRSPTVQELAEHLGVSVEELVTSLDAVSPIRSLHEVVAEDDDDSVRLEHVLPAPSGDEALALRRAIEQLEPSERRIVLLRYFAEKSQTEVAQLLGISQAQVSRIEKRIVAELRHHV
ncbi:MAG: SigB/SigF/SigG family RNA polymerase sigma factor [Firmicutes bacterium]|jgi:RNA polymerase sporulation-specific sigma factor|nr:SigB/SigF/SigG family RNA polymerase sigma factor [Bacillota bacterium]